MFFGFTKHDLVGCAGNRLDEGVNDDEAETLVERDAARIECFQEACCGQCIGLGEHGREQAAAKPSAPAFRRDADDREIPAGRVYARRQGVLHGGDDPLVIGEALVAKNLGQGGEFPLARRPQPGCIIGSDPDGGSLDAGERDVAHLAAFGDGMLEIVCQLQQAAVGIVA